MPARLLLSSDPIVTDVEMHSTAPQGGMRARGFKSAALGGGVVVTILSIALVAAPRAAVGDPLSSARAQAAQISAELQADAARADALSQQYEGAQAQVQQIQSQVQQTQAKISADEAQVHADQINLRKQAIATYMSSGNDTALESLFGPNGESSVVADEYRNVASGNISTAIDSLDVAQKALDAERQKLQASQAQAQTALDAVASDRQAAEAVVAQQQATLGKLNGQIAALVAQQQAAAAAAQHAAFLAKAATQSGPPHAGSAAVPAVGGAALPAAGGAATAVRAAESQIGVPYQWGGEAPGVGFDCSGLTQWSWGQAGVGIPRTAQAQYDAVAHVSLNALQPGDLVFWGNGPGGVYHVAMYVGGGDVVQAPQTGEDVQIDPIWGDGLVGAGRP
jgi:peptidoglycan DL-endopeptidase CwlO